MRAPPPARETVASSSAFAKSSRLEQPPSPRKSPAVRLAPATPCPQLTNHICADLCTANSSSLADHLAPNNSSSIPSQRIFETNYSITDIGSLLPCPNRQAESRFASKESARSTGRNFRRRPRTNGRALLVSSLLVVTDDDVYRRSYGLVREWQKSFDRGLVKCFSKQRNQYPHRSSRSTSKIPCTFLPSPLRAILTCVEQTNGIVYFKITNITLRINSGINLRFGLRLSPYGGRRLESSTSNSTYSSRYQTPPSSPLNLLLPTLLLSRPPHNLQRKPLPSRGDVERADALPRRL